MCSSFPQATCLFSQDPEYHQDLVVKGWLHQGGQGSVCEPPGAQCLVATPKVTPYHILATLAFMLLLT